MINAPFKAVCYMLATIALLSVSDAAAKWLVPHYPAVQIVFLRALLGVGPALALVVWEQGRRGLATSYLFAPHRPLGAHAGVVAAVHHRPAFHFAGQRLHPGVWRAPVHDPVRSRLSRRAGLPTRAGWPWSAGLWAC